ncbi:hypothetical protein JCM19233_2915 [Vibrio astriarenae]|nr:hypothetical protein JCM19233_2915 [Vibrio sp. C7]
MLAKPFLTHSLSALLGAIEEYQDILLGIYVQYQKDPSLVPSHLKAVASKFENVDIDKGYERAIRECALLEEDDTASYFANYVAELQVFFSRMEA